MVAYGQGGRDSDPRIVVITPGEQPTTTPLFDLPIADVTLRSDERLAMLRVAAPFAVGPSSVSVFSVAADGTDLRRETINFVISEPSLSPDGTHIIGLRNVQISETGVRSGDVEIVNVETGERTLLDNIPDVLSVMWGP
jgi:hypothetical protein